MVLKPHLSFKGNMRIEVAPMKLVKSFDYLGVRLSDKMSWAQQLRKSKTILFQRAMAIGKKQKATSSGAVTPALEVYRATAVSGAVYGKQLWGWTDTTLLINAENQFIRSLFNLPRSTPFTPLRFDLGLKRIDHVILLKRLMYWV